MNKKKLHVYYKSGKYTFTIFEGTTVDEIERAIRIEFNEPTKKIRFQDEDGDIVVLSSSIPNGTSIYCTFEGPIVPNVALSNWSFDPASNTSPKTHFLKNNNKTVYQPYNEKNAGIKGNVTFSEGIHYWVLTFDKMHCCVYAGVVGENEEISEWSHGLQNFEEAVRSLHSVRDHPIVMTITFVLDMSTGPYPILRAFESGKKKAFYKIHLQKKKYSPAVYFKHVLEITIIETGTGVPNGLQMKDDDDVLYELNES